MRLAWYAGVSTALAAGVVVSAFHQRANFYSAMVYLSQSNVCLMILVNLVFLLYGTFIYGLQRVCFGQLRATEIEQLYEKGWFAVTETCLAMTIFRDELGGFFLVMFTALVTGKVWGWIFEGRVEVLEQQPPANPRLFHARLIFSLFISLFYDYLLLNYAITTVVQQAKPTMMVMFLFEFAILSVCTIQTAMRYAVALMEINITKRQMQQGLETRRKEVREERAEILRRREAGETTEAENDEPLPDENDVTEDDIEVSGWEAKGQYVLILDLCADLVKLCVYVAFFFVLLGFYGLPIHIMRDLFITTRSFLKRLHSLMRYRQAMRDLDKYADATEEELARENTCIICREEMRVWTPGSGQLERTRPKRLPCGHILHAGCLRSWMERQAVCPTCRRSVMLGDRPAPANANRGDAVVLRLGLNMGGGNNQAQPPPAADGAGIPGAPGFQNNAQQPAAAQNNLRMINLGPLRIGFAQGGAGEVQNMIDRLGAPAAQVDGPAAQAPQGAAAAAGATPVETITNQLREIETRIQREFAALNASQQEATTLRLLLLELQRIRDQANIANGAVPGEHQPPVNPMYPPMMGMGFNQQPPIYPPQLPPHFQHNINPLIPPRIHSPSVVRLGPDPSAPPIPSGSADLPEGVSIPQGWSLLPLQRLDGNAPGGAASPAPSGAASMIAQAGSAVATPSVVEQPQSQDNTSEEPAASSSSSATAAVATLAEDTPVAPIAQPQPVAPNWGGAAQFFRNNSTPVPQATTSGSDASAPSTTEVTGNGSTGEGSSAGGKAAVAGPSEQAGEETSGANGSTSKGKARAVSVEEADDDDAE